MTVKTLTHTLFPMQLYMNMHLCNGIDPIGSEGRPTYEELVNTNNFDVNLPARIARFMTINPLIAEYKKILVCLNLNKNKVKRLIEQPTEDTLSSNATKAQIL